MAKHLPLLILLLASAIVLSGGGDGGDGRVVTIAREAADRQAEQNRVIAKQNQETAATAKHLVEADGQARRELAAMQRDLQNQQAEVGKQRDALENERRQIAAQRHWESALGPTLEIIGVVLVCCSVLSYLAFLAYGLRSSGDSDPVMAEVLIEDMMSSQPVLVPPSPPLAHAERLLPPPPTNRGRIPPGRAVREDGRRPKPG
jgi:hypothetical protein